MLRALYSKGNFDLEQSLGIRPHPKIAISMYTLSSRNIHGNISDKSSRSRIDTKFRSKNKFQFMLQRKWILSSLAGSILRKESNMYYGWIKSLENHFVKYVTKTYTCTESYIFALFCQAKTFQFFDYFLLCKTENISTTTRFISSSARVYTA